MLWICTGRHYYPLSLLYYSVTLITKYSLVVYIISHYNFREKFKNIVFVYISDDLEWGRQKLERKAQIRNLDIYFVGDNNKTKERDRDRDRYTETFVNIQGLTWYTYKV